MFYFQLRLRLSSHWIFRVIEIAKNREGKLGPRIFFLWAEHCCASIKGNQINFFVVREEELKLEALAKYDLLKCVPSWAQQPQLWQQQHQQLHGGAHLGSYESQNKFQLWALDNIFSLSSSPSPFWRHHWLTYVLRTQQIDRYTGLIYSGDCWQIQKRGNNYEFFILKLQVLVFPG